MSIALRMTIWYALTAFSLIFVATGILYWVLVTSLHQENVRDLADNLNNARLLLGSSPSIPLLQPDRRPSWAPPHQPEIYLRVLDQEARTLIETPGMSDELPPPARAELPSIRTPDGEKREVTSQSGTPFFELIVRVPGQNSTESPRFMQVAMDREHEEYLLARYRDRLWLVLTFSLVVCSLVGFLIAKGGMRPITHISHIAERIGSTTLHERIATPGLPTELSGLAETFNSMLDRLEESFLHISQFSDDVAHELRTPINNLHGEIEVALSKARSGEYYREILASCLEECTRISRLIQSLLFLARTGSAAEALQRNHIDVGKELATVQEFYEAAAAEASVDLQVSTGDDLSAHVDRTLFQQAIGNLVSNAIAHTPPEGTVQIAAHAGNDGLTVSVTDTGCGIAAEHLPYVFERFYRVDRARSSAGYNVGLGLAVVKSIAVRHGGRIEIDSEMGRGTQVRVILPAR
jgi:two-component system heavy metal sensor histidine kinase CusS